MADSQIQDKTGQVDVDVTSLWERVDGIVDSTVRLIPSIILGLVVFGLFLVAGRIVKAMIHKALPDSRDNLARLLGRLASWTMSFGGFMAAVTIIAPTVTPGKLLTTLGVGGVAIGFAFKDILQNFLAGVLILLRQPFEIGDQIIYNDFEGTVEKIEARSTLIKTYDGRRIVIPNGEIYTHAVTVNTAFDQRRSQYDVGIGYGDDIEEAIDSILSVLQDVEGVLQEPKPEVLVSELAGSSVNLRARWWTKSDRASVVHIDSEVKKRIKQALDKAAIDMPYPTQVMLFHDQTEATDGNRERQREGWPAGDESPEAKTIARSLSAAGKASEKRSQTQSNGGNNGKGHSPN